MIRREYNNTFCRTCNPRKPRAFDSTLFAEISQLHVGSHYITFDGIDDKAMFTDGALIGANDDFTIEFWIRPESTSDWQRVFTQSNSYTPLSIYQKNRSLALNFGASHELRVAGVAIVMGDWQHMAFRRIGSNYTGFWFGKAGSQNVSPSTGDSTANGIAVRDGDRNFANISLWQFRVWDYGLSQLEICRMQSIEPPYSHPRLKAFWPMDEGSGSTLNDVTGNGWDATLTGGTWT